MGAGYSAGDAPDRRKNPELYRSLQQESEPPPPPQQQQQRTTGEGASGAAAVSGPKKSSKPATSSSGPALPASSAHAADAASPPPMAARRLVKPEVLAPAGGWPQLKAAVENGADAVYFGVSEFNARARAENFTLEGLHEVMTFLHDRGVRGYLAMNVLIFDEELRRAEECVRAVAAAGVDAAIVQDLGLVKLIRRVAPSLPIHGAPPSPTCSLLFRLEQRG